MTLPRVPRGPSRAGESEMFSTLAPRNGHRWLAFSGSLIGHVASVTLCAAYLQFLATHPEPPLFARRTMIPPMEIRLPETMAALEVLRPKQPAPKPTPKQPAPRLRHAQRRAPDPPLSAALQRADSTLLQPELPPDLKLNQQVRLPMMMFWAAPHLPRPTKPFIVPAHERKLTETPKLPAPPKLKVPNQELRIADLKIAAAPPLEKPALPTIAATTAPMRNSTETAPPQPIQLPAAPPIQGDPVSLLSLPRDPLLKLDRILVPPGNQISGAPAVSSPSPRAFDGATDAQAANGPLGKENSATGLNSAHTADASSSAEHAPKPGVGDAKTGNDHSNEKSGPAAAANASAKAPPVPPPPAPALTRITQPRNGDYEVVVVRSSSSDAYPETSGLLSGKPVYTVFVKVNSAREWILQYCFPNSLDVPVTNGSVVQLGNPPPVRAPYPFVIVRPQVTLGAGVRQLIVHGFVNPSGKFERLTIVGETEFKDRDLLFGALEMWEFRPAQRDGVPTTVEILLLIPRTAV